MKYILSIFLVFVALVSCQKEITEDIFNADSTLNPIDTTLNPNVKGIFKAKIDGAQWVANQSITALAVPYDSGRSSSLLLQGINLNNNSVGILIGDFQKGTYQLVDTVFNSANYTDSLGSEWSSDEGPSGITSGSVTITAIDTVAKTFSGTFAFKLYSAIDSTTRTFTEGVMTDIPYQKNAGTPPGSATDTFNVKINDTLFSNPYSILIASIQGTIGIATSDSIISKGVSIYFKEDLAPGTYKLDSALNRSYYFRGVDTFRATASNPGTLQILENNATSGRIRGNFSFTGLKTTPPNDSARLTNGYFSIDY